MPKDSLAQGAPSAQFSAGQATQTDPIEFHGTVATEELCPHGIDTPANFCALCNALAREQLAAELRAPDLSRYQPMNDRVLLRRIEEKNEARVVMPDAFVQDSDIGEVIAVGDGMLIGGELRPIPLVPGDRVRFGHYNAEDIQVEGVKLVLVSAFDVRLKIKA
jgi:chaperonin GroES